MKYLYIDQETKKILGFNDYPNRFCNVAVETFDVENFNDYYYIDGTVVINSEPRLLEEYKISLQIELNQIKKWFYDTDYFPHKIITREWQENDERWVEYLAERQIKRARKDVLEELLKDL